MRWNVFTIAAAFGENQHGFVCLIAFGSSNPLDETDWAFLIKHDSDELKKEWWVWATDYPEDYRRSAQQQGNSRTSPF